jgi:hypothetical protein
MPAEGACMSARRSIRTFARGTAVAFCALAFSLGIARPALAAAPLCPMISATLDATIDTKKVRAGDLFSFTTVASATSDAGPIPLGSHGVGVIQTMNHSRSQGLTGYLVLEARYVELPGGAHVPVAFVPAGDGKAQAFVRAGSSDAGILTVLPYYIGTAAGIYDAFHHGKDAAVVRGTDMPLVVGDGYYTGACRLDIDRN